MQLPKYIVVLLVFIGCNAGQNANDKGNDVAGRKELSMDSKIYLGNRLFSEKTCITCHLLHDEKVGPSVVDIVSIYNENDADIVGFLRGNSDPIVDTDSSQVAIMQANIDGFLQNITDVELDAIETYMQHVKESQYE